MLNVKNHSFYNLSQRIKNFFSLVTQGKNQSVLEDKVAQPYRNDAWVLSKRDSEIILDNQSVLEDKVAQPYRNDAWVLSKRDSEIILDAMENPPAPSKALLSVFE
ncbi:hypothetical protein [Anabaena sp. UHCC 0204]|uniref:hypothetical protein n=1 Tax=Anabaena sp. UHCC 0204 TaxID=2590009 RepID=UPI00144827E5|nr:hypothetical protein [Anabaena sp. UHCC 0204]MTJ10727.1 hypothetical protein [Anabaena sp. UHCC 0204]